MLVRKLHNALSVRERFLLVFFIWACLIAWAAALKNSYQAYAREKGSVDNNFEMQNIWFGEQPGIEAGLQDALTRFDPDKTFSDAKLATFIDEQARAAGLSYDFNSNDTQEGEIFNIHQRRINVKRGELAQLINFGNRLKEAYPYLGLLKAQFVSNTADYRLINAEYIISSFELKKDNLTVTPENTGVVEPAAQ